MTEFSQKDVIEFAKEVSTLCKKVVADKEVAISKIPLNSDSYDARITAYSKLINSLNSLQFALTFLSKNLMSKTWWINYCEEIIPKEKLEIHIKVFNGFCKIGFIQLMFSAIESSFRIFLRELDPQACNAGTADFKSIYECLLKSKLDSFPLNAIDLLDLLRLIRNTIHNNGVFFHPKSTDTKINWKGDNYIFKHGKKLNFITWPFILTIADDIRRLLHTVVLNKNIQSIDHLIIDPYA